MNDEANPSAYVRLVNELRTDRSAASFERKAMPTCSKPELAAQRPLVIERRATIAISWSSA